MEDSKYKNIPLKLFIIYLILLNLSPCVKPSFYYWKLQFLNM